jgi:hypothetical protein
MIGAAATVTGLFAVEVATTLAGAAGAVKAAEVAYPDTVVVSGEPNLTVCALTRYMYVLPATTGVVKVTVAPVAAT